MELKDNETLKKCINGLFYPTIGLILYFCTIYSDNIVKINLTQKLVMKAN